MPATVTTKELFPAGTADSALHEEIRLRIKAGAIRSWIANESDQLILYTEWNVIGSND